MPTKVRLDSAVMALGLAPSRERARALILAGKVRVGGHVATKPGSLIAADAAVTVDEPDHPYVGRGGLKLEAAIERFCVPVEGRVALDIGASTGGFTDVLLRRGALAVMAVDVGHGQLDWSLRTDPRVIVLERVNARYLEPSQLPSEHRKVDIVTVDVSFISLRHILPVIPPLLHADGDVVALVKPQFEAGRAEVGKGGIVRDPDVHVRVVAEIVEAANRIGLTCVGQMESAVRGAEGNREYFVHLRLADEAAVAA